MMGVASRMRLDRVFIGVADCWGFGTTGRQDNEGEELKDRLGTGIHSDTPLFKSTSLGV